MPQNKKSIILIYLFFIAIFLVVMSILINHKDYDCSDFKSQEEAQRMLRKHDKDIYHLDGNSDGVACNALIK